MSSARVTVTLEIEAEAPDGVPDEVVRIVSENSRALKYGVRGGMRPARRAWPARESAEQPARAGAGWGAGRAGAEGGADAGDLRARERRAVYLTV